MSVEPPPRARLPYAGLASRALALAIDVALAQLIVLAGLGVIGLVSSLVGELRPAWLAAALAAAAWALVIGSYLILFWSITGQTPGMRLLRLRVVGGGGEPPTFGRSVARFVGLILSIVPLFAGFIPVVLNDRRRGLHDYLGGTTVRYDRSARL